MKFASGIVALMILFSVVSCTKDDFPNANRKRLEKIVQRWHDSLYYSYFKYNQDGRVNEIISVNPINNPLDTFYTSIEYNSEGKFLNYRYRHNLSSFHAAYTFIYDKNGRITEKRSLPTNSRTKSYGYDQEGRLVIDSNYYFSLNSFIPWGVYEYDNRSDVVKWRHQYYDFNEQKIVASPVIEASYNSTVNTLGDLAPILYHILEYEPFILSKHNVSHVNYNGYIRSYTYEYHADGLIKKIIYNNDKEFYDEFLYE